METTLRSIPDIIEHLAASDDFRSDLRELDREELLILAAKFVQIRIDARNRKQVIRVESGARRSYGDEGMQKALAAGKTVARDRVLAKFGPLFEREFAIGNGYRTTWGKASIGQHMARRDALFEHIESTKKTYDLHVEAIEALSLLQIETLEEVR